MGRSSSSGRRWPGCGPRRACGRAGFSGRLTLVGDEPYEPYDRPPLSKQVLTGRAAPESTDAAPGPRARRRVAARHRGRRIGPGRQTGAPGRWRRGRLRPPADRDRNAGPTLAQPGGGRARRGDHVARPGRHGAASPRAERRAASGPGHRGGVHRLRDRLGVSRAGPAGDGDRTRGDTAGRRPGRDDRRVRRAPAARAGRRPAVRGECHLAGRRRCRACAPCPPGRRHHAGGRRGRGRARRAAQHRVACGTRASGRVRGASRATPGAACSTCTASSPTTSSPRATSPALRTRCSDSSSWRSSIGATRSSRPRSRPTTCCTPSPSGAPICTSPRSGRSSSASASSRWGCRRLGEEVVIVQGSTDERRFVALYGHRGSHRGRGHLRPGQVAGVLPGSDRTGRAVPAAVPQRGAAGIAAGAACRVPGPGGADRRPHDRPYRPLSDRAGMDARCRRAGGGDDRANDDGQPGCSPRFSTTPIAPTPTRCTRSCARRRSCARPTAATSSAPTAKSWP